MSGTARIQVELVLRDVDLAPEELAARSGLKPAHVWRRGETAREGASPRRDNGIWFAVSDAGPWVQAEQVVAALLDRVEPYRERIAAMDCRKDLNIVVHANWATPSIEE